MSYATAILFTVGSAGFFIGVVLLLKFYFGEHAPRAIPLLSAQISGDLKSDNSSTKDKEVTISSEISNKGELHQDINP